MGMGCFRNSVDFMVFAKMDQVESSAPSYRMQQVVGVAAAKSNTSAFSRKYLRPNLECMPSG